MPVLTFVFCVLMLTGCGAVSEYVPKPSELIIEEYYDTAEDNDTENNDIISENTEDAGLVENVSEDLEEISDTEDDAVAVSEEESIPEDDGVLEVSTDNSEETGSASEEKERVEFTFRNKKLLNQHYEKHGIDMGFSSAEEYEKAACDVLYNPDVLKKTEKEDGDYVFYVEETNEFVVVSTDGYIRTYFLPDSGKAYYDRQ